MTSPSSSRTPAPSNTKPSSSKPTTPFDKLPITYGGDPPAPVKTGADKVSEDANIGETGDPNLKPGDTRTFTIKNMTAGNYVIVCNLAGHYGKGMRATFTVTRPTTTVNVTLGDTNGLAGPMTLTVSPATAPAGDVTFVVKNTGTIEHEAVVLKTNVPVRQAPRSPTAATHPSPSRPAPTKSAKTPTSAKPATPTSNPATPAPSPSRT